MENNNTGPPRRERPGEDTGPTRASADDQTTDSAQRNAAADMSTGLRRRRAASHRLVVLECGCADPWTCRCYDRPPSMRGVAEAAAHLLSAGLSPVFDLSTIRATWRHDRELAWELARLAGVA